MRAVRRLGILGGSFNPVHVGHLRLACEARETLRLDRVDLMPSAHPPHKSAADMLPYPLRLRLLSLAVDGRPGLGVSEIEGVLPPPSYTYQTLRAYRDLFPATELFFILGSRDLWTLPAWHRGLELIQLAHLAVADREGDGVEAVHEFVLNHYPEAEQTAPSEHFLPGGGLVRHFAIPRLDVSSTMLRDRWRQGRSLAWFIPEAPLREMERLRSEVEACWGRREDWA